MADQRTKVAVPLWALEFILENADLCDEGPAGAGWLSDEMQKARDVLQDAMKEQSV